MRMHSHRSIHAYLLVSFVTFASGSGVLTEEIVKVFRQIEVILRWLVTNVPGRQPNPDGSPRILPPWMVLHNGNVFGCLCHKVYCIFETRKFVGSHEFCSFIRLFSWNKCGGEPPLRKLFQSVLNLGLCERFWVDLWGGW